MTKLSKLTLHPVLDASIKLVPFKVIAIALTMVAEEEVSLGLDTSSI